MKSLLMENWEKTITIQSFKESTSFISIKLNTTNYLHWKSQVSPLIKSMGIEHHLTPATKDKKRRYVTKTGIKSQPCPCYLDNKWWAANLLAVGIVSEDVLNMIEGTETSYQIWKSLEEQLLTMTKKCEIHVSEALVTLNKGSLTLDKCLKKLGRLCDKVGSLTLDKCLKKLECLTS